MEEKHVKITPLFQVSLFSNFCNFSYEVCNILTSSKLVVELPESFSNDVKGFLVLVCFFFFNGFTSELLKVKALPQAKHDVGRSCANSLCSFCQRTSFLT